MKKAALPSTLVLFLVSMLTSCQLLPWMSEENDPLKDRLHFTYPIQEGLDVKVSFENQKTYDAAQLGLFLLATKEHQAKVTSVEASEFFPKYLTLINMDIKDGLLFISEKEATNFARASYISYQKEITSPDYLNSMKEHRVLEDVLASE
ncbi:MAG: hypothetical protein KJ645_08205 [Planctomycetes bacterium]|nr:hypothetical protein [Planctomycetota bacterium]